MISLRFENSAGKSGHVRLVCAFQAGRLAAQAPLCTLTVYSVAEEPNTLARRQVPQPLSDPSRELAITTEVHARIVDGRQHRARGKMKARNGPLSTSELSLQGAREFQIEAKSPISPFATREPHQHVINKEFYLLAA